jgi:hypothetical protein
MTLRRPPRRVDVISLPAARQRLRPRARTSRVVGLELRCQDKLGSDESLTPPQMPPNKTYL